METVVIIGNGMAGLTAAIQCQNKDKKVILVSASEPERSQSVMAMGGINAALDTKGEGDTPWQHYEDTIKAGCDIGNSTAIEKLTADAPQIVNWLTKIGVNFTRDEYGRVDVRKFGGQKKLRTAYAGARTGKQIMTALISEARKYKAKGLIEEKIGWRLLKIIIHEGKVKGVLLIHRYTEEIISIETSSLILAFGAPNGLFGKTTGSALNDGSAGGIAFKAGIGFQNLEMIQYHPTTIDGGEKRILITEAARGQGGRLFVMRNNTPWYFMEEWYPEYGNLMPRDVVSRSIYKVCKELGYEDVYLDLRHIPEKVLKEELDEVVSSCHTFLKLDPHKKPIPIYPGIHYFMGGIRTDEFHRTNIKGIFAAGECSSQYHGANRLGGNSTLGAIHGGIEAAKQACKLSSSISDEQKELCEKERCKAEEEQRLRRGRSGESPMIIRKKLAKIMNEALDIMRDDNKLKKALGEIEELRSKARECGDDEGYYGFISVQAIIDLALGFIHSALERKESRGAHQRSDYPQTNVDYEKSSFTYLHEGSISIIFGD